MSLTAPKRRGHTTPWVGAKGEAPELVMRQKERGELWAGAFPVLSGARNGGGRVSRLSMASLNNFSGLWGVGSVQVVWYVVVG